MRWRKLDALRQKSVQRGLNNLDASIGRITVFISASSCKSPLFGLPPQFATTNQQRLRDSIATDENLTVIDFRNKRPTIEECLKIALMQFGQENVSFHHISSLHHNKLFIRLCLYFSPVNKRRSKQHFECLNEWNILSWKLKDAFLRVYEVNDFKDCDLPLPVINLESEILKFDIDLEQFKNYF